MKRFLLLLTSLLAVPTMSVGLSLAASATSVNAAPDVVPAVQQWTGGSGHFQLGTQSDIVVNTTDAQALAGTAETLKDDLKLVTGKEFAITSGTTAGAGDIFLTISGSSEESGSEGYDMEITDSIVIKARQAGGIFYGTRTLLQMLKLDSAGQDNAPKGTIRDYPTIKERGIMLDAGRRYYSMEYIEDTIKRMAWHKMNSLHMHFTEWNGFRLQSDGNPGLAPEQSYSKADIRRMQDIAKKYHVMIVPEIDLPGHATAINRFKPELNFACSSMRQSVWYSTDWTIDITKEETRKWVKDLLDEFIPLFDAPYFHIGGDEYQYDDKKNACPELVAYAQQRGFAYTGDVFVDWINEVNAQVKSYGKTLQMWNWWEFGGQKYSITPDKDIVINVWKELDPAWFINQGYDVVSIPEPMLYVTPGLGLSVNLKNVYENWYPIVHDQQRGYRLAVWADRSEAESDEFFEEKSGKARQVLAERLWGGPRSATVDQYLARVKTVGDAPGVINPLPVEPLGSLSVENSVTGPDMHQFQFAGSGWGHGADSYNKTTDAYYQMKFTGTQVKLWGAKDPKHGIAGISIDGGPETEIDLYAASRSNQYFYTSPVLSSGEHTIKVRVTGKKNAASADQFVVIDRADIVVRMMVDNSVQGTDLYQFNYVGQWKVESDSYSKHAGDYFEMNFRGRQLILAGAKGPLHGIAGISIDGGPEQKVDLYAVSRVNDVLYYVSPYLGPGTHRVRVRVTGEKHPSATEANVVIDRAEIVPDMEPQQVSVSLNGPSEVKSGDEVQVELGMQGLISPVQAQELIVQYDAGVFDFLTACSKLEHLRILGSDSEEPGRVYLIAASTGAEHAIHTEQPYISLKLRAKSVQQTTPGRIHTGKALLSDAEGRETEALTGSLLVKVAPVSLGSGDINSDGKVSIGDLAMVAANYGKSASSPDWQQVQIADVTGDGEIGLSDLVLVASKILQ